MWYPFRQKTLDKLKANVGGIQERSQLALQILQLDTEAGSQNLLAGIVGRTDDLMASVSHIVTQNQHNEHTSETWERVTTWISPADVCTYHDTARQQYEEETGNW